ncbi:MAG: hypothetical protein L3J29_09915 [Cyclobacteriaceae bacterium]|nr:hypothetical protein [Cyclobacteriaceae bacterium]
MSDTVELVGIESSIKKIADDFSTVPKSKNFNAIIPPQLITSVVGQEKNQFNKFFGLVTNQKEIFLSTETLPRVKKKPLDSSIGTEQVKIDSLPLDSSNAKVVVSEKTNYPVDTLKNVELTSIERNNDEKISLGFDDVLGSTIKNSNAINTPFKVSTLISQKKKQFETLIGFQTNNKSIGKEEKTTGNQILQVQKDTLFNLGTVAGTQADSLKLDTARVSEVAENKINTSKVDSINQTDSTNYKLQKFNIAKNIENEVDKLVPSFDRNQLEGKIEDLALTPEKALAEVSERGKISINQFDKGNSVAGVALPDVNTSAGTFPQNTIQDVGITNDLPTLELNGGKLSSAKAQGFMSVVFDESALNKMVDQLKGSGKESYIKMTETYNPENYLANANNRIENEQKKATSYIENQEKLFSGIQSPIPQNFGSINHRIVSKDVLKGADSLASTESFTRYKEKVKNSAEGRLKEIKIKESKDLLRNSFTELDLSINQLDANSLNITPKLGYHFLKQLDIGAGLNVQVPGSLSGVEKKLGYEVFSRFNVTQSWYLQAQGVALIPGISNLEGNRETFDKATLLGVGYVQKMGNKVALDLSILHNPNQSIDLENYKGYQWKMRVGIRFYENTELPQAKKK